MKYSEADIEALKAPGVLHDYCAAALGAGKRFGNVIKYPCPFGAHTRLKLEVTEKNGNGVAYCHACGTGGTVFSVAAAVRGLDAQKDFLQCVEEVAERIGYRLTPADDAPPHTRRKPAAAPPPIRRAPAAPPPAAPVYLPAEHEQAAFEAVKRAAARPDKMKEHAAALGLPDSVLLFHTDEKEAAALGLLGLDAAGRLIYVYTARDAAGALRITMTKRRSRPGEMPRFMARGGKSALWGIAAARDAARVIITEGESDALAVRAAFWEWFTLWAQDSPDTLPAADIFPAICAKPDAGTFREAWAAELRGKDCILCADNDPAGEDGAKKTARILHAAGVRRVFIWHAPAPAKDARAALDAARPWLLADDIMLNKKLFEE